MPKLLLYFPLAVMGILAVLSLLGLTADAQLGSMTVGGDISQIVYYDWGGHAVCYANLTAVDEPGWVYDYLGRACWVNDTGVLSLGVVYPMFWDVSHELPLEYDDVGQPFPQDNIIGNIVATSTLGFIALIVGLMALGAVAGLRVLGSGTSEFSVSIIVLGTAYLALWGVFSVLGFTLISSLENYGLMFWLGLSLLYTLGIIGSFKDGSGDSD